MESSNFSPFTEKIELLTRNKSDTIEQLNSLFKGKTKVYIDYANVKPWSEKLGWHVEMKRLMQFMKSFDAVQGVNLYQGTLQGDRNSEALIGELEGFGYKVTTKPVKLMKQSIDVTSINNGSPELLTRFIRGALLKEMDLKTIEYLNGQLKALNTQGVYYIEDRKCNFDVEIGVDMLLDQERNAIDTYVLWSGDSDFADPLSRIIKSGHNAVVFASPRLVARELNELRSEGLFIFDIQKIKDLICWKRELTQKGLPKAAPKL